MPIRFLLCVVAGVLLGLASLGVHAGRVHLGWLGLAVGFFTTYALPEL